MKSSNTNSKLKIKTKYVHWGSGLVNKKMRSMISNDIMCDRIPCVFEDSMQSCQTLVPLIVDENAKPKMNMRRRNVCNRVKPGRSSNC